MHFNRPCFIGSADKLPLHLGADTAAESEKRFTGTADKLPLHFNRPRFAGTADKLPFHFGGGIFNGGTPSPVDDGRLGMCVSTSFGQSSTVDKCTTTAHAADGFDDLVFVRTGLGVSVDKCFSVDVDSAHNFNNCITSRRGTGETITQCLQLTLPAQALIEGCHIVKHGEALLLEKCVSVQTDYRGPALEICDVKTWGNAELLQHCKSTITSGEHLNNCNAVMMDGGVMVQCDHYEIPEPPPPEPPPKWVCGRPSAKKLTLHFNKRNKREPASLLSFHFACEDDKITIPIRTTYMYEHKITAEYNNNPIEIFSCNFSRDISQHAWRGAIDISVESFNALTFPLPEIKVTINGVAWVVVVENYSDTLKFTRESYSLDVRSLSCLLGSPHFIPRANTYATQEYARQIVNKELAGTGFSIGSWSIVDWLIPANTIKYDTKTPIEVINEVIKSVGGIVECDRVEKKLHIKPKWKAPAWQVSAQTPDVELPAHVIEEITGQDRNSQRKSGVTVFSDVAAQATKVTRNNTNGSPELPMLNASLATTRDARVFAAQQALSETGTHRDYTIKTELYPEENMHLANFGDIWKAHDPRGIWFGTVTGVKIDVSEMTETSPVEVRQNVSLDSFKGD